MTSPTSAGGPPWGGGDLLGVVRRRPNPELALEQVYTEIGSLEDARLVLAFFACHYPLSMHQQIAELRRARRVSPAPLCTADPLSTAV